MHLTRRAASARSRLVDLLACIGAAVVVAWVSCALGLVLLAPAPAAAVDTDPTNLGSEGLAFTLRLYHWTGAAWSEVSAAGVSAGGMPTRVKCLHVLAGQSLGMGRGVNPLGDEVVDALGEYWKPGPCV